MANRDDRSPQTSDGLRRIDVGSGTVSRPVHSEDAMSHQWWNQMRYQLYAPVYEWLAKPWEAGRKQAIERLELESGERILILGCGTGTDLEYLPADSQVVAIDRSPATVRHTIERAERLDLDVDARVGDVQSLSVSADRPPGDLT